MKRFVFVSFLSLSIFSSALAQMSTRPSPKEMLPAKKSTFDSFYERLRIGYFGVVTTPQLSDIRDGNWQNAATYTGDGINRDTAPTNLWNQLSFNYNFGAKMSFVVNPRFIVPIVSEKNQGAGDDRSFIWMDDVLVGFQGVVASSEDKSINLWMRPGIRLPTSRGSQNSAQAGAGTLTNNIEIAYSLTYDLNKTWQLSMFGQIRQWIIDDQFGTTRFRFYTSPYVQYTISDVSRLLLYYESMLETDRRSRPASDRKPVFKDIWQNSYLGYSYDITPKFNVMPFVSVFVKDTPITDKSVWLGAWISYQIK